MFKLSAYDNKSDPREHDEVALEWVTVMAVPLINILLKYIIMLYNCSHLYPLRYLPCLCHACSSHCSSFGAKGCHKYNVAIRSKLAARNGKVTSSNQYERPGLNTNFTSPSCLKTMWRRRANNVCSFWYFTTLLGQSSSSCFIFNLPDLVRVMEQFVACSASFHFVRGAKSVISSTVHSGISS